MSDVNKKLKSIGKKIFVDFYYDFKDINTRKEVLAKKLLNENINAQTLDGQLIRIGFARKIFEENEQLEALKIIISSNRVDGETIKKAQQILKQESNKI